MSTPVADPADLALYMGAPIDDANWPRGILLIGLAQALCETIVSPLPSGAVAVVLSVAARAYANPTGAQQLTTPGPFNVGYTPGASGLYLSRSDRLTLRRLSGTGGAFSIDTLPQGVATLQLVTVTGSPTGGTFALTVPGSGTTAAIAEGADYATIQAALDALPNLAGVTVTGAWPVFVATFPATLGPVGQMTATSSLTGGTSPQVLTSTSVSGVFPPGFDLPWWDTDGTR